MNLRNIIRIFPKVNALCSHNKLISHYDKSFSSKMLNFRKFTATQNSYSTGKQNIPGGGTYMISFQCNVCKNRTTKLMSKMAYEKGLVIIVCDSCKSKHLIADRLGWFNTSSSGNSGEPGSTDIEKIMQGKGEKVTRGKLNNPKQETKPLNASKSDQIVLDIHRQLESFDTSTGKCFEYISEGEKKE